ncbi:MAG TPA: hypothetical protein VGI03_13370 [Verrucomicrobiae bacterium]
MIDPGIRGDIDIVIEINEAVVDDLPIGDEDHQDQRQTDQPAHCSVPGGVHPVMLTEEKQRRNTLGACRAALPWS